MFSSNSTQVSSAVTYIEDVFSTYLYTGNGSTQTITNGIDLSGKGGLVWLKMRNFNQGHLLFDTIRGTNNYLQSASSDEQFTLANSLTAFNTNGFSVGSAASTNTQPYVGWSFRKQPKFFDIVTWTGDGVTTGRQISHSLASTVGCIIAKNTSVSDDWYVWHRGLSSGYWISLNQTSAQSNFNARLLFGNGTVAVDPTSSVFTVGSGLNTSGQGFVAYLYAHNAGGFGLTGTDNVISCGSYTGNGSANGPTVTLGYEPQWLLVKNASSAIDWYIIDNMRGWPEGNALFPNLSDAESAALAGSVQLNSTGFKLTQTYAAINASGSTYIYIAIRRGPMKVPTVGTSVYIGKTRTGNGSLSQIDSSLGFSPDWAVIGARNFATDKYQFSRLQGNNQALITNATDAEFSSGLSFTGATGTIDIGNGTGALTNSGRTYIDWYFGRAPSFFDEVCYTTGAGTGQTTFNHNLGVIPELVISKIRAGIDDWYVYAQPLGTSKSLFLNNNLASQVLTCTDSLSSTQAKTYLGNGAVTAVSYLFATCAGVSKVGNYTGTGATQTISCGFTGGARFVLVKRTDSTGDWYVWDTARGMVSGTDPSLRLNSTAAEVNANSVYTTTGGFQIVSTAAGINASGGTYIFLAIA